MTITELRRVGASVLEVTPIQFIWDSDHHSMPQDTLDLELKVNTNREMPAGAQEPVEQVLSVEWPEITLHGEWKDQWMGQGFADRTYVEFAKLIGRVPLVRIELGPHSLIGLITNLKIKWRTVFEIGYSFAFSVHKNETIGDAGDSDLHPFTAVDFTQRLNAMDEMLGNFTGTLEALTTVQTKTEDVDNASDNVKDLQNSLSKARFVVDSSAFESQDSPNLSEIVDRVQHVILTIAAAFSSVRSQAQENLLNVQELVSADVLAVEDVISTLHFEEWTRTQYTECVKMIGAARAGEIDARARAARKPRGIHRVRSGDTLDRVSMKWYGTPDSGRLIRDANNLSSIVLPVGADLIIPDTVR
jgi:hypothetical protein